LSGEVNLRNVASLTGIGQVSGAVSTQGGVVQTLDNGSPGFTATGWSTVTGQGFGNDVAVVAPQAVSGSQFTANWSFTGLTPGSYRVLATWTSAPDHSSSVLYTIRDNTTLRSGSRVNQELAPDRGPRNGGVVFQTLAGVNITSGTLNVQLSNQVS